MRRENYLSEKRLSRSEYELLFALRTKMIPGIKKKFSSQYGNNLACELCSQEDSDSQEHLLSCSILGNYVKIPQSIEYEDIFRNVEKQLRIVKIFKQILRIREILQSDVMSNSHQVSPVAPVNKTVSQ